MCIGKKVVGCKLVMYREKIIRILSRPINYVVFGKVVMIILIKLSLETFDIGSNIFCDAIGR